MMTALATVTGVHRHGQQYDVDLSCEQQTSCSSCSSQKAAAQAWLLKRLVTKRCRGICVLQNPSKLVKSWKSVS